MRCEHCGYPLGENQMECIRCHMPVQIVPDYSSFDDYLISELQDKRGEDSNFDVRQALDSQEKRRRKRKQLERRRKARLRKKIKRCILFFVCFLILGGIGMGIYRISYPGLCGRGEKALKKGNLKQAQTLFERGIKKNDVKPRAYVGLSKVYLLLKEKEKAEQLYENILKKQPQNVELFQALIQYYIENQETEKIPNVLEESDEAVKEALKDYRISPPKFSLKEKEVFDEVQELTLSVKKGYRIYYTLNGKEPNLKSKKYKGPILLQEGKTKVIAMSVDERNIPSLPVKKTYKVELPIANSPAVSPSTGQYSKAKKIEIKVPEGYTAYYTMDRSDPTIYSHLYSGPIEMPEGETLFKAVLIDSKGRSSDITTRNYLLESQ